MRGKVVRAAREPCGQVEPPVKEESEKREGRKKHYDLFQVILYLIVHAEMTKLIKFAFLHKSRGCRRLLRESVLGQEREHASGS